MAGEGMVIGACALRETLWQVSHTGGPKRNVPG